MPDITSSLGICVGATTVSAVKIAQCAPSNSKRNPASHAPVRVVDSAVHPHEGNPRRSLVAALRTLDLSGVKKIAATGRNFRHLLNVPSISEPEAVEHAFRCVKPPGIQCPAVICAGGETFMVYKLNPSGQITNVFTGNKCAAGTGEFFQQQLRRLGYT